MDDPRDVGSRLPLVDLVDRVDGWMAEAVPSESSREIARQTLRRFVRFAAVHGVDDAFEVDADLARMFVAAPTRTSQAPSVATQHQRRWALRLAFRLWHETDSRAPDPTRALYLQQRSAAIDRPLTEIEVDEIRAASRLTLSETRLPVIVALAEASATVAEIAEVDGTAVDSVRGGVALPGSPHALPRTTRLTEWGIAQVQRRLDVIGEDRLAYDGTGVGRAGQASITLALGRLLGRTRLADDAAVGLGSLRATAGRRAFDATGRIESAAHVLGCRSLDTAARLIGWDWTQEPS